MFRFDELNSPEWVITFQPMQERLANYERLNQAINVRICLKNEKF